MKKIFMLVLGMVLVLFVVTSVHSYTQEDVQGGYCTVATGEEDCYACDEDGENCGYTYPCYEVVPCEFKNFVVVEPTMNMKKEGDD